MKEKTPIDTDDLTIETLKPFIGKKKHNSITQEVVDNLNAVRKQTGIETVLFNEQVCLHLNKLCKGISIADIANAVMFVQFRKISNISQEKSWRIVFPKEAAKIDRTVEEGGHGSCSSRASMYASNKIVAAINEEVMVSLAMSHGYLKPVMFQKLFMLSNGQASPKPDGTPQTVSPMVQMQAASKALDLLQLPEDKMSMDGGQASSIVEGLMEQLSANVAEQRKGLLAGKTIADIQRLGISVDSVIEVDIDE